MLMSTATTTTKTRPRSADAKARKLHTSLFARAYHNPDGSDPRCTYDDARAHTRTFRCPKTRVSSFATEAERDRTRAHTHNDDAKIQSRDISCGAFGCDFVWLCVYGFLFVAVLCHTRFTFFLYANVTLLTPRQCLAPFSAQRVNFSELLLRALDCG